MHGYNAIWRFGVGTWLVQEGLDHALKAAFLELCRDTRVGAKTEAKGYAHVHSYWGLEW